MITFLIYSSIPQPRESYPLVIRASLSSPRIETYRRSITFIGIGGSTSYIITRFKVIEHELCESEEAREIKTGQVQ